jgi:hypothetical protein
MNDCLKVDCHDECCRYGADVYPEEYAALLEAGLATPEEFTGPEEDEEDGVLLYRTALQARGCIFLKSTRGCRLHESGKKPYVCTIFPRDEAEALEAHLDGYLSCIALQEFPKKE